VVDGVQRAATAAVLGAGLAGVAGWLIAHPLSGHAVTRNLGSALAVGVMTVAIYLAVAAAVDRTTLASLLRRLRARRG
jgi:hypothetical protein